MLENLKLTVQMWYDDFMYQYGPERLALAKARISAHELAMKMGYESPYIDPENYDVDWKPIAVRKKV